MDSNNSEHNEHQDHQGPMMQGKTCNCNHHKVVPILVILFGLTFLLAEVNVLTWGFVNIAWPVILIIAGGTKLMSGSCKCCTR